MAAKAEKIDTTEIKELYGKFTARKVLFFIIGLALLVILAIVATSLGVASLGIGEVARSIVAKIFPFAGVESTRLADIIVWQYRMPPILMAIVAGMGFAVSGSAMQGVMRNPLVSPFTIGISSAAGFGASLAIVLGVGMIGGGKYLIIANAFFFALMTAFLVYGIARIRGTSPETLILAGIAMMYLFSAGTSLLQYLGTKEQVAEVVYWLFGSLAGANWEKLLIVFIFFIICFPFLIKYSWDLNALAAGDETAASLGVNTRRVRVVSMALSTLITAAIVCFTGIIGFVCLVAPHITRMLIGADHRFLLPGSAIVGALLLLGADTLGRTVIQPSTIPVGIVTAFIGVPMFVYLLITRRRQYWQ
jgi:iron complex transport system permease protein